MKFYSIRIDEEVRAFLQKRAIPFEDTENSVLRRLLGIQGVKREASPINEFPRNVSVALRQILEVVSYVNNGYSRQSATQKVASERSIAPQTVFDKYSRQLGKNAYEIDKLLRQENREELIQLLKTKFPHHEEYVKKFFAELL